LALALALALFSSLVQGATWNGNPLSGTALEAAQLLRVLP